MQTIAEKDAAERAVIRYFSLIEHSMKVFVTDDSEVFRKYLIEMLCELEGVEIVGQAGDAQEALKAIRVLPPDVLTLDMNIRGGSGIEVLIRAKEDNLVPVVIMLTNQSSVPYRKKCMQAGADFFVDKANELVEMRRIVEGLLPRFNAQTKAQRLLS
ncbi:MAG TPA: response regulator [Blastocatellia bacterium]|nr:response regulator [Blastocatellia bacterium]